MFELGEKVEIGIPVTVVGVEKRKKGPLYRVKFDNFEWSFIVEEKDLKKRKINLCDYAPFPKCNNAEGCESCQFNRYDGDEN